MIERRTLLLQGLALAGGAAGLAAVARDEGFREITWLMLVPKDWNPRARLGLDAAAQLDDSDPKAKVMMSALREVLDTAPTVAALDNTRVRMPGYVVPLEQTADGLKEFLLVPYFGACIHTPPPPANQIVHVFSAQPVKGFEAMTAVWVSGTLSTKRNDSGMAVSGYAMQLAKMEVYRGP